MWVRVGSVLGGGLCVVLVCGFMCSVGCEFMCGVAWGFMCGVGCGFMYGVAWGSMWGVRCRFGFGTGSVPFGFGLVWVHVWFGFEFG